MITDEEFAELMKAPEFAAFAKKCLEMGLDPKAVPSFTKEFGMIVEELHKTLDVKYQVKSDLGYNILFLGPKGVPCYAKELKAHADEIQGILESKYGVNMDIIVTINFHPQPLSKDNPKEVQELTPNAPKGGVGG